MHFIGQLSLGKLIVKGLAMVLGDIGVRGLAEFLGGISVSGGKAEIYDNLLVDSHAVFTEDIKIGNFLLTPTSTGIKITRSDGKPANLIVTGEVTAYGN